MRLGFGWVLKNWELSEDFCWPVKTWSRFGQVRLTISYWRI